MPQPTWKDMAQPSSADRAARDRLAELIAFVKAAAADPRVVVMKVGVIPSDVLAPDLLHPLVALGDRAADVTVVTRRRPGAPRQLLDTARTLEDHGVRVLLSHGRHRRLDAVLVRTSYDGLEVAAVGALELSVPNGRPLRNGLAPTLPAELDALATGRFPGRPGGPPRRAGTGLARRLRWFNELTLRARPIHHDKGPIVPVATAEWVRTRPQAG